ncbi:4-galactosyl-N-acetylglucosaminide 3-alpha-L-fucosyltransferase 9-like [Trachinotus anak]|uniref:4-galactosyl-N-acetylglucosaminide 3-alpha-L-fucosyltransferase 9-like n=1 Tax=Trachinotus anak TaxID=443729 RepID=UPI0039F1B14F
MWSSCSQKTSLRRLAFGCLVVMCFLFLLFTYYKPEIKFPAFGFSMRSGSPSGAAGLSVDSNPNCSREQHICPLHNDSQRIQGPAEQDTLLLIWMWPFGSTFELSCTMFNITRCHLTDDRSLYHRAHGVFFHHRDIHGHLKDLPKEPRPSFQKWVWSNMESPANSAPIPELNNLFNLTCSYRLDSNIPVPYGYLEPLTSEDDSFQLPAKNKLVCWIVSNWNLQHRRVQYYDQLKNHVHINCYGNAFGQHLSNRDYSEIVSSCKFYLSFENSVHRDYITEKLYSPMMLGSVPIVLGPSRPTYEDHVPADSFIHVDDFSSAKELADRLLYLDQNATEYRRYFDWRSRFRVKTSWFGREQVCRTCGYLQKNTGLQVFHDLNRWFWG